MKLKFKPLNFESGRPIAHVYIFPLIALDFLGKMS